MKRNKTTLQLCFTNHSVIFQYSVTRTREIKAAAVILISLFSRVKDFQSTLKKAENYPNTETFMETENGFIFQVYSDMPGWLAGVFTGQLVKLPFYRKKLLASRDCERGWPTGCGAGKTREGKFSQRAAAAVIT